MNSNLAEKFAQLDSEMTGLPIHRFITPPQTLLGKLLNPLESVRWKACSCEDAYACLDLPGLPSGVRVECWKHERMMAA